MKKLSVCRYNQGIDDYAYSYCVDDSDYYYSESIRYTYTSASVKDVDFDESCFYLNAKLFA